MSEGPLLLSLFTVLGTLLAGLYLVSVLDEFFLGLVSEGRTGFRPLLPIKRAALLVCQQRLQTERPDAFNQYLATGLYFALAATGLALVPWSALFVPVQLPTGVVLWGAVEVCVTVVIFLYGWSANAHFPLLGAYRYVALGLSTMLVSMFVLIGVALPAESLDVVALVESQERLWNVIRQPLGLPLFLIVGLGLSYWGPLNLAAPGDLASGIAADSSGSLALAWEMGRRAMLVSFSFIAATAFLGGWLGPVLPGPVWLVLKSLLVLCLLLLLGHLLPRPSPDSYVSLAWVILLPLSFLDLIWAGVLALW